jgi:N utilization substance protein B
MAVSMRHQARELAMQALYEWDVAGHDPSVALERLIKDQHGSARLGVFAMALVEHVTRHQAVIDDQLAQAAAERPLAQMARIEKAILRLAISEILFDNGVPAKAAINEAVELAKTFGGENSARFINGVLGTIYTMYTQTGSSTNPTPTPHP